MATRRSSSGPEDRSTEVARRYLRGESQAQTAEALGCSSTQVGRDLAKVERHAVASCASSLRDERTNELANIDALEAQYGRVWGAAPGARREDITEIPSGALTGAELSLSEGSRCGNPAPGGVARLMERRWKLLGLDAPAGQGLGGEQEEPMTEEEAMREVWRLMGSPSPWDLVERPPMTAENLPPGFPPPPAGAFSGESLFERLFGFPYESKDG